jgi:hypothetical protein
VLLKCEDLHSVIVMIEMAIIAAASDNVKAKSCGYGIICGLKY